VDSVPSDKCRGTADGIPSPSPFLRVFRVILFAAVSASLAFGCRSVEEKRRDRFSAIDAAARRDFRAGNYAAVSEKLRETVSERTPELPLYHLDRASALLLSGDAKTAKRELLEAYHSIDEEINAESERRAAGLWSGEAEKLYKGDPYERCAMCLLLALCFLDEGDADNALAALKTGLLADSDSEKGKYKSDFALLMFLAAKCCDIRGEPERAREYLDAAFRAWLSFPGNAEWFADALSEARDSFSGPDAPSGKEVLSRTLLETLSMASERSLVDALKARGMEVSEAEKTARFGKELAKGFDVLDFNCLAVIWRGLPPEMRRLGRYGEKRVIIPGVRDGGVYDILVDGAEARAPMDEFGDLNYQATTRGGRRMDSVLERHAFYKLATNTTSNAVLIAAAATRSPVVSLALLGTGLVMKIVAALMNPKADIRHWGNLPREFDVTPLSLPPGEHVLTLAKEDGGTLSKLSSRVVRIGDKPSSVAVVHFRPSPGGRGAASAAKRKKTEGNAPREDAEGR